MTGAQKTLRWYYDYLQINKIVPTAREIKQQLEKAIAEEQQIYSNMQLDEWVLPE